MTVAATLDGADVVITARSPAQAEARLSAESSGAVSS
jgi:hypothetical protein